LGETLTNFFNELKEEKEMIVEMISENSGNRVDQICFEKLCASHIMNGHSSSITAIDICEQKNLLVSGSLDCKVKLWDLMENKLL